MNKETAFKAAHPLAILRAEFPAHQISKLPKPTKAQTDKVKADFKAGIRCQICGAWHHPDVVHLDYVGHAALTDRLLDTDMEWSWEPLALDTLGLPAFDTNGGLWIKLTVGGVTRLGYGSADGKSGGNAKKEIIGDALRNAAMRFGAALDLWHKGDLHADEDTPHNPQTGEIIDAVVEKVPGITKIKERLGKMMTAGDAATDLAAFKALVKANRDDIKTIREANHGWWTGDGDDWQGFEKWMESRYEALTPVELSLGYTMLLSALEQCATRNDLNALIDEHRAVVEMLDGEESRRWSAAYDAREAGIMAASTLGAG